MIPRVRMGGVGIAGAACLLFAAQACGGGRDAFEDEADKGGGAGGFDSGASVFDDSSTGSFGDGAGGGATSDGACAATVASAQRAEVEIIVVIDTSGSMDEETAQVKANINTFASKIGSSGLDYRVIMIAQKETTVVLPAPLPPFKTPGICVPEPLAGAACADKAPRFRQTNTTVGSRDSLSLILSTYDSQWKGWIRPDSYKVFIEITDDDSDLAFAQFDTQLLAKAPAGVFGTAAKRKYIFNSICGWKEGDPVPGTNTCSTAVNPSAEYQGLSKLTGGIVDSVCKTSYAAVFDNIAKGLVSRLGCEFAMPKSNGQPVDPDKLIVRFTPGTGAPKSLTQVTDVSKCGTVQDAWYYDNNTTPTQILLCPSTCTAVAADTGGKMEIAAGCKAPPPR